LFESRILSDAVKITLALQSNHLNTSFIDRDPQPPKRVVGMAQIRRASGERRSRSPKVSSTETRSRQPHTAELLRKLAAKEIPCPGLCSNMIPEEALPPEEPVK
jgi:hypothetical protein